MKRCSICVIPDTRPDTPFVDGVCSACLTYAKRPAVNFWEERHEDLVRLLDRFHGECIVPSSGGKDSTYQALRLKELGANVTAVTASTCHLTPIGRRNIDNLARHVRTIEVSPNKTVRAKLNWLGLTLVGDISWPEHVAIFTTPFRMAADLGIPLVIYGENPQNQYGGPAGTEGAREMTMRWRSEFGGFLGLRPSDLVGQLGITARDMLDYAAPSAEDLSATGVEAHFLGQYEPWDSRRNLREACAAGMRSNVPSPANWWAGENLDNAQTGLHDYFMYLKYGYGRGAAQVSVDIRTHGLDRGLALGWVREHDGDFPYVYAGVSVEEVLTRIGMTTDELKATAAVFTNSALFEPSTLGSVRPLLKAD